MAGAWHSGGSEEQLGLPPRFSTDDTRRHPVGRLSIAARYDPAADVVVFAGPCEDFLPSIPTGMVQLVITSPPYNIGKSYERRMDLREYVERQRQVIAEAVRVLDDRGSLCWQVGNHVDDGEVFPLDAELYPVFKSFGLKLRNRIIWCFEHGLHASRRLSGRHEAILWFTKTDDYLFDVDPIRAPQKYPNKRAYKGPRLGQPTGHLLGKNPGDVWVFPTSRRTTSRKRRIRASFPSSSWSAWCLR
jgi:adenine-specific DNA-methyltransferase